MIWKVSTRDIYIHIYMYLSPSDDLEIRSETRYSQTSISSHRAKCVGASLVVISRQTGGEHERTGRGAGHP